MRVCNGGKVEHLVSDHVFKKRSLVLIHGYLRDEAWSAEKAVSVRGSIPYACLFSRMRA